MDLKQLRSVVISALFSDDVLFDTLVLKGGNALDIVYNIGSRSSVDIDVSMPGDFNDVTEARTRIFRSLEARFAVHGYRVFDQEFEKRPSTFREGQCENWGGYQVKFKLISSSDFEKFENDVDALRRRSATVGPLQQRKFKIDISKFEFCSSKIEAEVDDQAIYVYSLPMMAMEKLRAICQQLPAYVNLSHPRPRARDFLDIYVIESAGLSRIVSPMNYELLIKIFAAKNVPIHLLDSVGDSREFHRPDWDAVRSSVSGELQEFDFYFDYVLDLIKRLKTVGIVDSPL